MAERSVCGLGEVFGIAYRLAREGDLYGRGWGEISILRSGPTLESLKYEDVDYIHISIKYLPK